LPEADPLRVQDVTLSYGGEPVLEGASLTVEDCQFVSLVGPSGSGKSSLLRVIIGLQQPLAGVVETGLAPSEIGILFQDDALLPWKTARENVALGLIFNLPVFVLTLVRLGVLTSRRMRNNRRIGYAIMLVGAALLPTVDPISLAFEVVPLLILYEASIWASVFFERRWHARGVLGEPVTGTES